jgi:branched-chain amino acid aminotransferase
VFAAGTAAVLVPVHSIEHRSSKQKFHYKDGKQDPGSCYTRLYETLKGIQQGTVEDSWRWTEIVREPFGPRHEISEVNGNGAAVAIS